MLANTNIEMILRMLYLSLSNAEVEFAKRSGKFTWRSYDIAEALSTTHRVEIIHKKQFAKSALNEHCEIFVMHITTLKIPAAILIHLLQIA